MKIILALVIFNLIFFWTPYTKPFTWATSELLSTFFPTWLWQGRQWTKWRIPKYEPCYWLVADTHPVLSTYYPVAIASAIMGQKVSLDMAFKTLLRSLCLSHLGASIGWYMVFSRFLSPATALVGAITLTYQAYHIKQQPCIIYSITRIPWYIYGLLTGNVWLTGASLGMSLLGGYYPILLFLLPVVTISALAVPGAVFSPWGILLGICFGLVQLVPFLRYLPRTIRKPSLNTPIQREDGFEVGPWERNYYFGLVPLFFASFYHLWLIAPLIALFASRKHFPRVWVRSLLPVVYAFIVLSLLNLRLLPERVILCLLLVQCFDLWWHNRQLVPTRPFSELYQIPSHVFNSPMIQYIKARLKPDERVSGLPWPLFTGIVNNIKTLGYSGGMQLKLMAKWRNDNNPNGSGEHDWFKRHNSTEPLERYRVRFAFTRKRIDWISTPFRHLYENPLCKG